MAKHRITVVNIESCDAMDHIDESVEFDYMPDALEDDDEDEPHQSPTWGMNPALIYELNEKEES